MSLKYIKTEQHSDEMSGFGFKVLLRARLILKIDFFFPLRESENRTKLKKKKKKKT